MTKDLEIVLKGLHRSFDIIVSKNFCDFFHVPSGNVFFFLKDLKKETFNNDQKLIFYFDKKINNDAVSSLYRRFLSCLDAVDIPKFFVSVLADSETIKILHTHDQEIDLIEIETNEVAVYDSAHFSEPKLLCGYPWISLHINQDGTLGPCNRYAHSVCQGNGLPYNANEHELADVFKSQYLDTLRQKFREGIRLKNCRKCWKVEDSVSGISTRQNFKRSHPEYLGISWETNGELLEVTRD